MYASFLLFNSLVPKNNNNQYSVLLIIVIGLICYFNYVTLIATILITVSTHNKMVLSESDTDSDDVLFEHRKSKSGSHIRNGKSRNGFIKVGPRIKA